MKTSFRIAFAGLLTVLVLLVLPSVAQAQSYTNYYGVWVYYINNGTVIVHGFSAGPDGAVTIPDRIPETTNGLPVTSIGTIAFADIATLTSVTIPNSVTSIGDDAFQDCTGLTNVTIGEGVTSIGQEAFYFCSSLPTVTIPKNVTSIGPAVFAGCTKLTAITVDPLNSVYASVDGVLFDKSRATLVAYPGGLAGAYTIPSSVTSIGVTAFDECPSLTSVTLGTSVTSIANYAFFRCSGLTTVTIPDSVIGLGEGAFQFCTGLITVTIGKGVTNIGVYAFDHCTNLTGVYSRGNAPTGLGFSLGYSDTIAVIYYMPGTSGWGPPAVLWNPQVHTRNSSFGVRSNQFGFNITGTSNLAVVVEASTNLTNPNWYPLQTYTLSGGSSYFNDPQWTNYPNRFYRLRWP